MSGAALKWAWRQRIPDGAMKPVLVALAYTHMAGKPLFPSQRKLADDTGRSIRAVSDALTLLEQFGLITRKKRSNGAAGRTSDAFALSLDAEFALPKKAIGLARRALPNMRKPQVAKPVRPVKSQHADSAVPPGRIRRGRGDEEQEPIQEGKSTRVVILGAEGAHPHGPALRVVTGGRAAS